MFKLPIDAKLVIIVWEDAFGGTTLQDTREAILRQVKPCVRYSPGWYLGETDTCHVIATDFDVRDGTPTFGDINQIPKGIVLEIIDVVKNLKQRRTRRKG